jgi:UPF0716 protein FxsA
MPLLLLLFIVWPVTELWLLFQLSDALGFFTTLGIVLGTGILGAWLAKWQGLQAIVRLQNEIRQGIMPAQAIGDGVLILVAGVLLLTPGAISDVVGLLLLVPPFRKLVMVSVSRWFASRVRVQATGFWQAVDGRLPGDDTVRDTSTVVEARVIDSHVVEDEKS